MATSDLQAYCFYKVFEPEPAKAMQFDRHYLLYSAKGAIRLEAKDRRWVLPPSRAAWIPAGMDIIVETTHPFTSCSVLFRPDFIAPPVTQCHVFSVTPVAREMILHTRRWGPETEKLDTQALSFFRALAGICTDLATAPSDIWIPKGETEAMQRALKFTQNNLAGNITLDDVAAAAHLSERSLARRFADEIGMTWRQMRRRMRMIRAIELLSNVEGKIVTIALDVGYESLSAFNRAFREFSGHTPSEFREKFFLSPVDVDR